MFNKAIFYIALLCTCLAAAHAQETSPAPRSESGPKIVVIYGDSITQGALIKDKSLRWASLVATRSNGIFEVANEGKGGRPTGSLKEFDEMLPRHPRIDLLVIALGANDARDVSGNCVKNAVKNVKAMITRARAERGAGLPILLVGPTNINKDTLGASKPIGPERAANVTALNAAFAELATAEKCDFVGTDGVVPLESLGIDGVHPNVSGHEEIAKVLLPAILKAGHFAVELKS